jgi:hypothetical protein
MFHVSQLLGRFAIKPYKLFSVPYGRIEVKDLSHNHIKLLEKVFFLARQ